MTKNYDEIMEIIGTTVELNKTTSENVQLLLNRIKGQEMVLTNLSEDVHDVRQQVKTMSGDIEQLKMNEEITTSQQESIVDAARRRICETLGNDPLTHKKYFRIFIQKLYSDCRKYAGLGSKISRTKKCDFQRCVDYIEAWVPSCGYEALRAKADANALARLEARKLGYCG